MTSPDEQPASDPRRVRPYAMTGGRTRPTHDDLELETLVSTTATGDQPPKLTVEQRAIAALCHDILSIAGIACNFTIDGRDVLVPMATEEPSVVAAASNAARIARVRSGFHTSSTDPLMQAQVQVVDVTDPQRPGCGCSKPARSSWSWPTLRIRCWFG